MSPEPNESFPFCVNYNFKVGISKDQFIGNREKAFCSPRAASWATCPALVICQIKSCLLKSCLLMHVSCRDRAGPRGLFLCPRSLGTEIEKENETQNFLCKGGQRRAGFLPPPPGVFREHTQISLSQPLLNQVQQYSIYQKYLTPKPISVTLSVTMTNHLRKSSKGEKICFGVCFQSVANQLHCYRSNCYRTNETAHLTASRKHKTDKRGRYTLQNHVFNDLHLPTRPTS